METAFSRRSVARWVAGGSVALAVGAGARNAVAAQSNGIASGGIGLTRTEFEGYFGPGEATQSHAKYIDPTYGGTIYAGYDFVNFDDGLLDFLELQWQGVSQAGGLSEEIAASEVRTVLPADARFVRRFRMGATPGGPIGLRAEEWASASIGSVRGGKPAILVVYQEKLGSLNHGSGMNVIVTAATIALED